MGHRKSRDGQGGRDRQSGRDRRAGTRRGPRRPGGPGAPGGRLALAAAALLIAGTALTAPAGAATPTPSPDPAPSPFPSPSPSSSPSPSPSSSPSPSPAGAGPFGAYLDFGPDGISRMAGLRDWLGGAEPTVGHTYLPGDVWTNIEGRPGFLEDWARWRREREDRLFVLNVPMVERNESRLPDQVVRQLLRLGADGRFDRHFTALAERLVALDVPDTVVVLGWEMNGTTYSHRCGPDPEAWKAYWRRIVTAMRAVPGQRFRFDFAPNRGTDAIPWTECYPGDDVVDIIGMDSYDQPPGESFDDHVKQEYGLRHHVEFAAAHGKPVSYPEWGLFRGGDNPAYMRAMLDWFAEHRPVYQTITDYCPHGVWQCGDNPRASEVFRTLMTERYAPRPGDPEQPEEPGKPEEPGSPQPSEPTPEPTEPQPTEPQPTEPRPSEPARPPSRPADCVPLDLGPWVEKWLGRRLCLKLGPADGSDGH
ncbi:glycoside hydrolase family 26 protein [Streptomyces sp. ODS05-4]|uniref:glycoside hydrolase family 26 protein n=1 Tax=Streptomyces sp. ODS05-4 TaxID=2944939 RepID=UPI00210CD904|nr:glycosyl hydrolase [Streptomyces sp. ODS05-4]